LSNDGISFLQEAVLFLLAQKKHAKQKGSQGFQKKNLSNLSSDNKALSSWFFPTSKNITVVKWDHSPNRGEKKIYEKPHKTSN